MLQPAAARLPHKDGTSDLLNVDKQPGLQALSFAARTTLRQCGGPKP